VLRLDVPLTAEERRSVRDVARRAEDGSVALFIDDLHRADTESLAVLGRLSRIADGLPPLMVGMRRSDVDGLLPRGPAQRFDGTVRGRHACAGEQRRQLPDEIGEPSIAGRAVDAAVSALRRWRRRRPETAPPPPTATPASAAVRRPEGICRRAIGGSRRIYRATFGSRQAISGTPHRPGHGRRGQRYRQGGVRRA
jgi:hypothetical protein